MAKATGDGSPVLAASSARYSFFLIGKPETLPVPTLRRSTLDAAFKQTPFAQVKSSGWRTFSELAPAEKSAAKRRWAKGDGVMAIAASLHVYPGDLRAVAESENWPRGGEKTMTDRIIELTLANPTMTVAEIIKLVGCSRALVYEVNRLQKAKAGAP